MMKKVLFLLAVLAMFAPLAAGAGEVTSKNNVDFYGYIKLDTVYQNAYAVMDNFLIAVPPGNLSNGNDQKNSEKDSFSMTARQSRFGFLINGPESDGGISVRGRLEMDFYGSAPTRSMAQDSEENKGLLMLRRAYVEIMGDNWSVLAGNEWMVVSPIFPNVNNYPYGADCGNLGYRTPQVRFTMYGMDKALMLQVAATNRMGNVDTLDIDTGRMYGAPTWEAGITYNGPFMIALTGHYGKEEIQSMRDDGTGTGTDAMGYYGKQIETYSGNISLKVPLGDMFAVSGEAYTGVNLDGWYTGGAEQGFVQVSNGNIEPLHSTGWWVELMVKPSDTLKFYGGWGVDDPLDSQMKNGLIEPGYSGTPGKNGNTGITKNSMFYGNVWYTVAPGTMISAEWMQMVSEYDLSSALDNGKVDRYTLSFWYVF